MNDPITTAGRRADPRWYAEAERAIAVLSRSRAPFTAATIAAMMDWNVGTPEPRAMGCVVRAAARAGKIKPTGNWRAGQWSRNHGRPQREWVGVKS
jgi:hypothetical protein